MSEDLPEEDVVEVTVDEPEIEPEPVDPLTVGVSMAPPALPLVRTCCRFWMTKSCRSSTGVLLPITWAHRSRSWTNDAPLRRSSL